MVPADMANGMLEPEIPNYMKLQEKSRSQIFVLV